MSSAMDDAAATEFRGLDRRIFLALTSNGIASVEQLRSIINDGADLTTHLDGIGTAYARRIADWLDELDRHRTGSKTLT
jgi:hypothetical protein